MKLRLADRVQRQDFQGDFVKMILQAASAPNIISFAGGLPNPISFPIKGMEEAAKKVLEKDGVRALQYNTAVGYEPLRRFIAARYQKTGADISADDIFITNGSQQALDIIPACLANEKDDIVVENPTYLAALQSFHFYSPTIHTVELTKDGVDPVQLEEVCAKYNPKFFYAIPNFQNPTGLTYTKETREKVAAVVKSCDMYLVEDNPYGEIRFKGQEQPSFYTLLGEQCIMLGTFSKTVSPGMRIGWICCKNAELRAKMISYKQLVDMHTNIFGQMVLNQYLQDNDFEAHIEKIKNLYRQQAETMLAAIRKYFPPSVGYTEPEGGMFIWATLPEGMTAIELSRRAAQAGVAFAAGDPFYEVDRNVRTLRLNYTNCDAATIEKGIQILAKIIEEMGAK